MKLCYNIPCVKKEGRRVRIAAIFPGTVVPRAGKSAAEFFNTVFFATKGIMLFQLSELTGLDGNTIQNWVVRGWVQAPVGKRYSADQLARVMLINMLKGVTRLETIGNILTYINGELESREDDLVGESQLYIYICDILDKIGFDDILDPLAMGRLVEEEISAYREPVPGGGEKLRNTIKLVLTYYAAALMKQRADQYAAALGLGPAAGENGKSKRGGAQGT